MGASLFGFSKDKYEPSGSIGGVSIDKYPKTTFVEVVRDVNPKPNNYKIVRHEQVGDNLVVEIKYLDCTNYEGRKILAYLKLTFENLMSQKLIDPHFSENKKYCSPFARFEPTESGWILAIKLCSLCI